MQKEKLTERIEIRVTPKEKNVIKMLADMYANGNVSAYIVDRTINSNRAVIDENNFELSIRRIKKGGVSTPDHPQGKDLSEAIDSSDFHNS